MSFEGTSAPTGTATNAVTSIIVDQMVKGIKVIDSMVTEMDKPDVDADEVVKTSLVTIREVFTAIGMNIEGEYARIVKLIDDKVANSTGYVGKSAKGIMEYKVMQHLKVVTGDKGMFRQWHMKLMSAISQVKKEYGVMLEDLVKHIDLGKPVDKVLDELELKYGAYWYEVSEEM